MKKSQRANLTAMEICNICTFGYNIQGIYTLEPIKQRDRTLEN